MGNVLGLNWNTISLDEFHQGMIVELEHGYKSVYNITNNDMFMTAKIALAHLIEIPDYYTRLKKMENSAKGG